MRYPIQRVHKAVLSALEAELNKRNKAYKMPVVLDVVPGETFQYYMKGIPHKVGFVLNVSLTEHSSPIEWSGQPIYESAHGGYLSNWGSWEGDLYEPRIGIVNAFKEKQVLNKGIAVIKCYVDRHNSFTTGSVIMYPSDMPVPLPEVALSDRERNIMFILGNLKSPEKEMAFARLDVLLEEIETLAFKKAIRSSRNGYIITDAGRAARLEIPKNDLW